MKKDDFGDRMKKYESEYTNTKISPPDYLCVRLDGKGFSKFTKGFLKPFDDKLSDAMIETTKALVKGTHATFGYTQSDEITLIYKPHIDGAEYIFGGKTSKLNSILASIATATFNGILKHDKHAYFDCRAFAAPSEIEASNVVLWRVQDARKNSISALFRWTVGAKEMHGLDQAQMKDYLLKNKQVDWNDLPDRYKYGSYTKTVSEERYLTPQEIQKIPETKRPEPDTKVIRNKMELLDLGYYGDLSLDKRVALIA